MIKIITGDTRAGKTTHLFREYATDPGVDGILQPVVDGIRCNYYLKTRELRTLESMDVADSEVMSIGNFRFRASEFVRARTYLSAMQPDNRVTILDEVGPLELEGKGIEPGLKQFFLIHAQDPALLIVVVRSKILDHFFDHYCIDRSTCSIQEFKRS